MGVSDESSAPAAASRKVFCFQCHHVGPGARALCDGQELRWSRGGQVLPWALRGSRHAWICVVHFAGRAILLKGQTASLTSLQWYTRKEQGVRTGIWFSFNGFAQIFGGLVAYGIATGNEKYGFAVEPWKIVFLLTGLLTSCIGILFLFLMPDSQLNAWFLTKEERILAIERVKTNGQGIGNKHFKLYQFKEALTDPLVWAFVYVSVATSIPNGGITNFFSQLIVGFGFTPEESLLYGTPGGAVEVVALILCGFLGDRYGQRILISIVGMLLSILGVILIVALPLENNGGRLAGYYLTQASPTVFVALLSLISTNVAGKDPRSSGESGIESHSMTQGTRRKPHAQPCIS